MTSYTRNIPYPITEHATFLLCVVVSLLPVIVTSYPPLFDYPNHLARVYILSTYSTSDFFHAHFELGGFLVPNVLADLALLALGQVFGILAAGRVFVALTLALLLSGTYALNRALTGRYSIWPIFVAGFLFNEMFLWGFLNYLLGLGLLLWGLAAWLHLERSRGAQLATGTAFALAIFLAHLVSFGLYGVAIAAIELRRVVAQRVPLRAAVVRLASSAASFVPALAIYFFLSPSSGLEAAPRFDFSLSAKAMPIARVISTGNPALDIATLAAIVGFLALALVVGRVRVHGIALLVGGLFLLLVLALPYSLLGSYFLDSRIVIAVVLIVLAGLQQRPGGSGGRVAQAAALVLICIVSVRTVGMVADWRAQDRQFARVLEALDALPRRSVVVTAVAHRFELGDWTATRHIKPSYEHTTAYAAIRREALVPNLFARRGQNPLVFAPSLNALRKVAHNPATRVASRKEARRLVDRMLPIARNRGAMQPPAAGVFAIGYYVPCDVWPSDASTELIACQEDFSLVRVTGARPDETAEPHAAAR